MKLFISKKEEQAFGEFNGNEIIENKPIGFPQDGGQGRPFSALIYWAHARAVVESTIGLHPHSGFEIATFVLKGRIHHFDTGQNNWNTLNTGDVQVIQSGIGISHEEKMEKDAEIFQIWFDPDLRESLKHKAAYKDYSSGLFKSERSKKWEILNYNKELDLLTEDIIIEKICLKNTKFTLKTGVDRIIGLYVLDGEINIGNNRLTQYDFVRISETDTVEIESDKSSNIFFIVGPKEPAYPTYGT